MNAFCLGRELLQLYARMHGLAHKPSQERIEMLLDLFDLQAVIKCRKLGTYSKGMALGAGAGAYS